MHISFFLLAFPGAPQNVEAAEIPERNENICIILVQWDPPANFDPSDIGQYRVSVTPQGIVDFEFSAISVLRVPNCHDDDTRIQVAAVNRFGCVGMNSSEVQPSLLDDIPNATADGASTPAASSKYFKVHVP